MNSIANEQADILPAEEELSPAPIRFPEGL